MINLTIQLLIILSIFLGTIQPILLPIEIGDRKSKGQLRTNGNWKIRPYKKRETKHPGTFAHRN